MSCNMLVPCAVRLQTISGSLHQEGDGEVENGLDGLPPLHGELGYTTCPVAKEVPEMIVHVPPPKD